MQSRVFRLCLDLVPIVVGSLIRGVIHAVMPADGFIILGVHAIYAAHVHPVFFWVRAALVMRVDATNLAEIVFRRVRSETVQGQGVLPLY